MKEKKKIIIILLSVILLVGIVTSIFIVSDDKKQTEGKKEKNVKENTNKNVVKEQVVDGIKISDIKVEITNGLTTFTAKATNITENPINFKGINIIVTGDTDVVLSVNGYSVINSGETLDLINYSDVDLEKATNIDYKVVY